MSVEEGISLVEAEKQNSVLGVLLELRQPLHLRDLMRRCGLTYQQVASCMTVLVFKGYVRRVKRGIYQASEDAKLLELSPEHQVKVLKRRVEELEILIKKFITLGSR